MSDACSALTDGDGGQGGEQAMGSKMQYHPPAGNPNAMPGRNYEALLLRLRSPGIKTQYHA